MNDPSAPTWSDYSAAVTRFTDAVDAVLERGRAAEQRYEQFCARHGIDSETSAAKLLDDSVPPGNRHMHRRLLGLRENLYVQFLGPVPAQRPTLAHTAARALRSRSRI